MIHEVRGDLLEDDADALVNAVNTAGVMGKGLALQFKRRFPAMVEDYARAARAGELALGHVHVWDAEPGERPRHIISFPTKGHWRSRSALADIATGLDDLARVVVDRGMRSIAVPALGCGLGGLDWGDVRPLVLAALGDLDEVDVRLYPPVS